VGHGKTSVTEAVIDGLKVEILAGRISVGNRLPSEAALAKRFDTSRPAVREALRALHTLGLTETRTGSGTWVVADRVVVPAAYGDYSARDLLEARPHIEVPAAGFAAERRSPAQRDELIALCDEMDQCDDPADWVQLDSRFHVLVAEASGNAVFARAVFDIRDALAQQSEILNFVAARREPSGREHREIATAISLGSSVEARETMRSHLAEVERVVGPRD
jgi:DNA-binding FadR family transcriptional regulator